MYKYVSETQLMISFCPDWKIAPRSFQPGSDSTSNRFRRTRQASLQSMWSKPYDLNCVINRNTSQEKQPSRPLFWSDPHLPKGKKTQEKKIWRPLIPSLPSSHSVNQNMETYLTRSLSFQISCILYHNNSIIHCHISLPTPAGPDFLPISTFSLTRPNQITQRTISPQHRRIHSNWKGGGKNKKKKKNMNVKPWVCITVMVCSCNTKKKVGSF